MRSEIVALAGFILTGSVVFAQPTDGRLKSIHETATLRVAYQDKFTAVLISRCSGTADRLHDRTLRAHSGVAPRAAEHNPRNKMDTG